MSFAMYLFGVIALLLGGYIATHSMVSDIQLGLVATALIGGLILIGIGAVLQRLDDMVKQPTSDKAGRRSILDL